MPVPAGASGWKLHNLSNMKLRTFIPRGDRLDLEARVLELARRNQELEKIHHRHLEIEGSFS